ncbi:MAG: HPF/RaiA family ribosome-associated protein, partial [Firmicutes bacterium]|nr:HPF/RaiA family ribosome-associated protein [Bacillota bacterium]
MLIRGEDEGYDIFTCIDNVTNKLESQIHKYRTRLIQRGRRVSAEAPVADEPHWVEDDQPVKVKTFTTKPMTVEEGIMQMNLLGHSFFVFVNSDGNTVNVLYRRNDGEYGLLMPEA